MADSPATPPPDCFALMVLGRRIGPFRNSREEAELDAVEMGHATREDGVVWLTAPADIGRWRWTAVE
ncbi:MAG: hypothetical protein V4696_12670 [Pseudomonadota bacterium]